LVPEWPKGADCKSVISDFGGSNPPQPTNKKDAYKEGTEKLLVFYPHEKLAN
jgi:hypothetical protein